MSTLQQLKNKILSLANQDDAKTLMAIYEKKNYNLLFRQASVKSDILEIMEFLYLHKNHFHLDVNATGASKKTALEFALEYNSEETVLFLLKLKEVAVDDALRDKINQYNATFRTQHITPCYVSLANKLIQINTKVIHATRKYNEVTETSSRDLNIDIINTLQQIKLSNCSQEKHKLYIYILNQIKDVTEKFEHEIVTLSQIYDNFEETISTYMPYSYAQEKLLYGNEFATSNLDSSMKNTCLHNRKILEETMAAIQHSKFSIACHLEQVMMLLAMAFVLNSQGQVKETSLPNNGLHKKPNQKASIQQDVVPSVRVQKEETTSSETIILSQKIPEDNTPSLQSPVSQSVLPKQQPPELPPSGMDIKPSVKNARHAEKVNQKSCKSNQKCADNPDKKGEHGAAPDKLEIDTAASRKKLIRLEDLIRDIAQLKQKGQVKLSAFLPLIHNVAAELNMELKRTKNGHLIEHATNPFSFHRPHKDKGVDKKAVNDLGHLVASEIEALHF